MCSRESWPVIAVTDLDVRLRAAAWYETAGMPDEAIEHALGAGDLDRAARLVLEHAQARYRDGRVVSLMRWIDAFDDPDLRMHGDLAALAAYLHALEGDAPAAARWAAIIEGPGSAPASVRHERAGRGPGLGDAVRAWSGGDARRRAPCARDARRRLALADQRRVRGGHGGVDAR